MGDVNFYLKAPAANKKSLIYLKYKYNGRVLVFTFGQSINPNDWNANKQRVKKKDTTTEDGQHSLNDMLDNLGKVCLREYNERLKTGIPEPETLKAALQNFIDQNKPDAEKDKNTLYKLIDRFVSNEIKFKGKSKRDSTIKTYKTTLEHLKKFEAKYKYKVDFETVNLEFFYKYVTHLEKEGIGVNARSKDIQILKVFMGEAVDLGYTDNIQFKHPKFTIGREDTDAVYLSDNEILNLYQFDLSSKKSLEQVRDLFVFGCYVGLRYSDYSEIKPENIVKMDGEYFIKLITKKTGELVIIPTNPVILQIFEKYKKNSNHLPKTISAQKFNEYIKLALEEAGFDEIGRLATNPTLALYDCVSSHTARRSFATNFYLQGFPTRDLMKITGHRTEKAFNTYIEISKVDAAKRLQTHIKKNWGNYLFKLAS